MRARLVPVPPWVVSRRCASLVCLSRAWVPWFPWSLVFAMALTSIDAPWLRVGFLQAATYLPTARDVIEANKTLRFFRETCDVQLRFCNFGAKLEGLLFVVYTDASLATVVSGRILPVSH